MARDFDLLEFYQSLLKLLLALQIQCVGFKQL